MKKFVGKNLGIDLRINAAKKLDIKNTLLNQIVVLKTIKQEKIYINDDATKIKREIYKKVKNRAFDERKIGKMLRQDTRSQQKMGKYNKNNNSL